MQLEKKVDQDARGAIQRFAQGSAYLALVQPGTDSLYCQLA